jgi:hypothetical protein
MARDCNCGGQSCGCLIVAGAGIQVTGIGTADNPFVIRNIASDLASSFKVSDTLTLDMVLAGSGTNLDPFILQGNVTLQMQQLSDVSNPGGAPTAGTSPTYVGTQGAGGHWEFLRPFRVFATADRPTPASAGVGGAIYDSTLKLPVWSDGAAWRNAAGAAV